jgi:hypothetical protein
VVGWLYHVARHLTSDGTWISSYDAVSRVTQVAGLTTYYAQDLAAPLSQVLQTTQGSATINYLYGAARLASLSGSTRTWYAADGLGCVRRTVADTGTPNAPMLSDTFSIEGCEGWR